MDEKEASPKAHEHYGRTARLLLLIIMSLICTITAFSVMYNLQYQGISDLSTPTIVALTDQIITNLFPHMKENSI